MRKLVRARDMERARHVLRQVIRQSPDYEQAWLWLAMASENPRQAQACWRQVLRIHPGNTRAIQALDRIKEPSVPVHPEGRERKRPARFNRAQTRLLHRWLGIWLLLAGLMVILGGFAAQTWVRGGGSLPSAYESTPMAAVPATAVPAPTSTSTPTAVERVSGIVPELEQAWERREWKKALAILNRIMLIDEAYPGLDGARCDTLLRWAEDEVADKAIQEAHTIYRQALGVCQDKAAVLEPKSVALDYLSGKWRYDHSRWREAATTLQEVYQTDPEYADVRSLLYAAYMTWAKEALAEGALEQAREASEAVLDLEAEDAQAMALLAEIQARLVPTPTPRPTVVPYSAASKRIEVNISQQRMYVWQGETLLYNWVCSTGGSGTGTAVGHFSVLNKIPEAWGSTWSLRMPYWMGIYQVGSLQNGIHALPILPNGQILWAGYLGSRVSYGCIILSTENAQILYNWADIGTPVWIHY
ncbi:MAG: L,D-transpeptidase family protein [Anaerolineae bacterium]|nr:L,D-transpeptidase family protein [Anaerolineae bacterium]